MKKSTFSKVAILAAWSFVLVENYTIEVDKFTVESKKIPKAFDGFKILQLSDFHSKRFGFGNAYLIHKIDELSPDIIIMTGDMVSREDMSLKTFYRLAQAIGNRYEVYYTVGNHELDINDDELAKMFRTLRHYGIHILNNEKVPLVRDDAEINLYGMWYGLHYYKNANGNYHKHLDFDSAEMLRLLGKNSTDTYSILMTHNPLDFRIYADWGADLTFSGHVHGGVIRLGRFGGLFSPGRLFFPEFYEGEYLIGDSKLIVSRGIGGFRLFNRPAIVLATLKSED